MSPLLPHSALQLQSPIVDMRKLLQELAMAFVPLTEIVRLKTNTRIGGILNRNSVNSAVPEHYVRTKGNFSSTFWNFSLTKWETETLLSFPLLVGEEFSLLPSGILVKMYVLFAFSNCASGRGMNSNSPSHVAAWTPHQLHTTSDGGAAVCHIGSAFYSHRGHSGFLDSVFSFFANHQRVCNRWNKIYWSFQLCD